jgi:hypothetical protein
MEIKIEDYLSDDEIKDIVKEEIRNRIRNLLSDNNTNTVTRIAKMFAKEEIQKMIPNFEELLNQHIREQIGTITLGDFFATSMGWKSEGNKIFNGVMSDNKDLIDAKIKELFNRL